MSMKMPLQKRDIHQPQRDKSDVTCRDQILKHSEIGGCRFDMHPTASTLPQLLNLGYPWVAKENPHSAPKDRTL